MSLERDLEFFGHRQLENEEVRRLESPEAAPACGTCGGTRKVDSGGQDSAGNWIERDCPECAREAAPKAAEAARPADPRVMDALESLRISGAYCMGCGERLEQPHKVQCRYLIVKEALSQAPESQPHTVHPWDALQALKDRGAILFFTADQMPITARLTLFLDGGRWVDAEAPTLAEAVRQAVAKLPVESVA